MVTRIVPVIRCVAGADEWHGNIRAGQVQLLSASGAPSHSQLNYSSLRGGGMRGSRTRTITTIHRRMRRHSGIVDGDTVRVWNHRGRVHSGRGRCRRNSARRYLYSRRRMADPEPTAGGICKTAR